MNQQWIVTQDHWAYGESAEAGNEPRLRAGEQVSEIGPRERGSTYVQRADGVIQRAALDTLTKAAA